MGAVIVVAGIWLLLMVYEPLPHVRVGLGSMALGYILAWYVPIWFKHRHVKSQNRLLDRCRALLMLGSRAMEAGDKAGAEQVLTRIRRLEWVWRLGAAVPFRISLALWAMAWAIAMCIGIRFLGSLVVQYGWSGKVMTSSQMLSELQLTAMISMTAPMYALMGYFEAWRNPWAIDNCGDRLWQIIYGTRAVETAPVEERFDVPDFDGLTPHQIFGVGPDVTRRQLHLARRRLVQELHPDRWHHAGVQERKAREEALKRVNAAYDMLKRQVA